MRAIRLGFPGGTAFGAVFSFSAADAPAEGEDDEGNALVPARAAERGR
ncbi:MAG TPA: hypothetical protein VI259_04450 [Gemmatimonadaceae bacterium]